MDYHAHYNLLMSRAPRLSWIGEKRQAPAWASRDGLYREGHRIQAGCLGGKYVSENVAYLTAKEHFVAHQLLVKMYPGNAKMLYAVKRLTDGRNNSRMYSWLREQMAQQMSEDFKGQHRSPRTEWRKGQKACGTPFKKGQRAINKGRISITNGMKNHWHVPSQPIPSGWHKGFTKRMP